EQARQRFGADPLYGRCRMPPLGSFEESFDEPRDVLASLAQRRQLDPDDVESIEEVLAEATERTRSSKSRWVAATMRTSASRSALAPRARTRQRSMTSSIFTWSAGAISPISSRNSVPPSASTRSPARSRTAPVKAPLT